MAQGAQAKLGPAYLIVGEDQLKREAAIARLKKRMGEGDFALFNIDERTYSSELSDQDMIASLRTLPFGSDFRLVILHVPDKLPKQFSEALVDYLASPNQACVFAMEVPKLAKGTRLFKAFQGAGAKAVVDCAPKKRWELPEYIGKLARSHGKSISRGAIDELLSRVGDSTVMLDNQIATLAELLGPKETIELADVEQFVARTEEVKWWDVLDAMCERNPTKAFSLLALMPEESYVLLHTQATNRLRELICAKSLAGRGRAQDLASELGVPDWRVKNHQRWARAFTEDELVSCLISAARLERSLKGSDDSKSAMATFAAQFCGCPV